MLCSSIKSFISCWVKASMGLGSSKLFWAHQSSMSLSARKRSWHSGSPSAGRKTAQVAGGHPGLGVHEDGGVKAHVVGVLLHRTSSTRRA